MTTISARNQIFCQLAILATIFTGACAPTGESPACQLDKDCAGEQICRNEQCTDVLTGAGGGGAQVPCFDLRGSIVCAQASDPGGAPKGLTAVAPPNGGVPSSASLNMTGFVVADQGGCGSCAAFATKDAMGERAISQKGSFSDFSAADIWYIAGYGAGDCINGSSIENIFSQMSAKATYVVDSSTWPYDPSKPVTSLKNVPPAATLDQGGVAYVEQVASVGSNSLVDMKNAIANGWPAVIGVKFFQSSGWGSLDGRIDVPDPGDAQAGGHAIMLISYDDANQTFGFVNSWGTVFGKSGFGTLTYAFLQQYSTGGVALETLAFKSGGCPTDYCSTNQLQPGSYCNGVDVITCGMVAGCVQVMNQSTCSKGCSGGQCAGSTCGNGAKEPGEQCDGAAFGGVTCQSQGFDQGKLICSPSACTVDTSACCKNQCFQQGSTQCGSGSTVQTCLQGALGCLGWGSDASCPNGCDSATGQCKGANPCAGVICNNPPSPQCDTPVGVCSGGACSYSHKPSGSSCSDGDACTLNDVCDGNGSCSGSSLSCTTPPSAQCYNPSGSCGGGSCFYTPSPSGTACNDGNPNTANDKCDGAGNCSGGCVPAISSVTPLSATLNQLTTFNASGSCLPPTTTPFIANCVNPVVINSSSTQITFQCTPSFSTGSQAGLIKDKPGGVVLYNFSLNVQPCVPMVSSVFPLNASLNQLTNFTISGTCMPTTIAPFIANCVNPVVTSTGLTQATFKCTPSFASGAQSGVIKDMPMGAVLKNFSLFVN